MNIEGSFNADGFCVVRGFADRQLAEDLALAFKDAYEDAPEQFSFDDQSPLSPAMYDFFPFVSLLVKSTEIMETVTGKWLLPSYCYARIYKNGDELTRHTDREACEISATVNLSSGSSNWPFSVKSLGGHESKVIMHPGDAVVYRGTEVEHWRERYSGNDHTQVFMHYVRPDGPYRAHYFDSARKAHNAF